ncbi:GGDEF domain-containing protein, partial [Chroococcidiopsidales cyanobacterium LEGE 13417]|nr:GGDEF domain-containing protein [Chroococcidiopsidales cyanobacterium LEGE 13417]
LVESIAAWGTAFSSQKVFALDECFALRRGQMYLAENTRCELCQHLLSSLPVEYICVPMMAQGEALGLLYLSYMEKGKLTSAKQRLAVKVAANLALALANLKLREILQNQNVRDPLTDLFNRRYLEATLEREVRRGEREQTPVGIIMLDVDRFKQVNDTFGHPTGDTLLRELGKFLKEQIRAGDIACRYGGEEFMLILPAAPLEAVQQRAERIREAVKWLQLKHQHQLLDPITLSLGVAAFPYHGSTTQELIQAADAALYRAKIEGRDRVVTATI